MQDTSVAKAGGRVCLLLPGSPEAVTAAFAKGGGGPAAAAAVASAAAEGISSGNIIQQPSKQKTVV